MGFQRNPFETGDILFDNDYTAKDYFGYCVVADEDEVYRIKSDKGDVELTSDWNPWDCERVRTSYWHDITDDFDDCPTTLRLIADYLDEGVDWSLAELLNDWNWALEQDFSKKKNENAFTEG